MEPERAMQEQQLFVISKVCEYHHEKLAWLKSEQAVQEIFESMKELSDAVDERVGQHIK